MRSLLLFLLLPIFVSSCSNHSRSDSMNNLRVLEGEWQSYRGVEFNESWRFVDNNSIEGEGFSLNGSDTSFFETLRIRRVGDSIYYTVGLGKESKRVDFLLVDASESSWTFVNPENDFPSIIDYVIEENSLLTVTISNIRGNKKQIFYLKKKS